MGINIFSLLQYPIAFNTVSGDSWSEVALENTIAFLFWVTKSLEVSSSRLYCLKIRWKLSWRWLCLDFKFNANCVRYNQESLRIIESDIYAFEYLSLQYPSHGHIYRCEIKKRFVFKQLRPNKINGRTIRNERWGVRREWVIKLFKITRSRCKWLQSSIPLFSASRLSRL